MTKSKVFMASAALAGLLAGSSASLQASNLVTGLAGSHAQDSGDKKVKEKHACKGQNSCKGNGGCKSSDNGCKGNAANCLQASHCLQPRSAAFL